jgi:hypothetical protein
MWRRQRTDKRRRRETVLICQRVAKISPIPVATAGFSDEKREHPRREDRPWHGVGPRRKVAVVGIERFQDGGGIAAAAAQARAHGMIFFHGDVDTRIGPAGLKKQFRGPMARLVSSSGTSGWAQMIAGPVARKPAIQFIINPDTAHQGNQVMITIGPFPGHPEKQVDFSRSAYAHLV